MLQQETDGRNAVQLDRKIGLTQATALNMIDMVGIGPFVVISLVIQLMNGPGALWAWVAGALLAITDGFIWAELGAAMPAAGGSYVFLRECFGRKGLGKFFSFLFIWQTTFQAPLVIASGAIGFANYFKYLAPLTDLQTRAVAGGVVILVIALLYRNISGIGKISVALWVCVLGTMGWIIWSGFAHGSIEFALQDFTMPQLSWAYAAILGQATVKTVYSYLGYYNVCHLGGEIRYPERNIPRSIFISIIGIAILYIAMNFSVLSVLPWREAMKSDFVISLFIERIYGRESALIATALILAIAFSSLFAVAIGYSRIPYAAAKDGMYFNVFAKLHPVKHFPHVSLLTLGGLGFIFSLGNKLSWVISAILAMRIIIQFIGGAVGVIFLRRNPDFRLPYRMILYPIPVVMAIAMWLWLFYSTGYISFAGIGMMALGSLVYYFVFVRKPSNENGNTLRK
ncbi:APC family permease [Ignavibacteria bacterium]